MAEIQVIDSRGTVDVNSVSRSDDSSAHFHPSPSAPTHWLSHEGLDEESLGLAAALNETEA